MKKAEHRAKSLKLLADGKDVAQQFMEDQLAKATDWLKDEKNREKVLQYGITIAKLVLAKEIKIPKK